MMNADVFSERRGFSRILARARTQWQPIGVYVSAHNGLAEHNALPAAHLVEFFLSFAPHSSCCCCVIAAAAAAAAVAAHKGCLGREREWAHLLRWQQKQATTKASN